MGTDTVAGCSFPSTISPLPASGGPGVGVLQPPTKCPPPSRCPQAAPPVAVGAAPAPFLGCLFCSAASTMSRGGRIRAEMQGEEIGFLPARRPAGRKQGHPATASGTAEPPGRAACWAGLFTLVYLGVHLAFLRRKQQPALLQGSPGVPLRVRPGEPIWGATEGATELGTGLGQAQRSWSKQRLTQSARKWLKHSRVAAFPGAP